MRGVVLAAMLSALSASGAEIVLVYPRLDPGKSAFEYDAGLDSTFVFGHVVPPAGTLLVNSRPVELTTQGAFLAWLSVQRSPMPEEWVLQFTAADGESSRVVFPYRFRVPAAAVDTLPSGAFPCVLTVTGANAHIRTAPGGSYFAFPEAGCRLLAMDHRDGYFLVRLGGQLTGAIEDRFVSVAPEREIRPALLGDGACRKTADGTTCTLALDRAVLWRADLATDERVLCVTLFGTVAALHRMRYDVDDPCVREVTWTQQDHGVELRVVGRRPFTHGFTVARTGDSLRIHVRSAADRGKGLRGRTIVIDPGHGGDAWGAVGPLGTKEKDVALRWARLLQGELLRYGAKVKLTREHDTGLDLYDRIEFARQAHADFLISLHANALPNGENPFRRHGSGTYYYQTHSRPAAEIIHRHVLKASGLPDDGLWDANLALVRPTDFPAVLIEAAYLIYPPEELLLRSDEFLRGLSRETARGIREYFESK